MRNVFVYGESEAQVLHPDTEGAVVRESDDGSETWFSWADLPSHPTIPPTDEPSA